MTDNSFVTDPDRVRGLCAYSTVLVVLVIISCAVLDCCLAARVSSRSSLPRIREIKIKMAHLAVARRKSQRPRSHVLGHFPRNLVQIRHAFYLRKIGNFFKPMILKESIALIAWTSQGEDGAKKADERGD